MSETQFIRLTCPNCGGKMEIGSDTAAGQLTCPYCGSACLLHRRGNTMSLLPLARELKLARAASERVAAELAVRRLNEEIPALVDRLAQWDEAHPKPIRRKKVGCLVKGIAILGCSASALWVWEMIWVNTPQATTPDYADAMGGLTLFLIPSLMVAVVGIWLWVRGNAKAMKAWQQQLVTWEKLTADERAPLKNQVENAERELQRNRALLGS